jgi:hypothetical protein
MRMKGTFAAFLLLTTVSAAGDDQAQINAVDAVLYDTRKALDTGSPQRAACER